MSEVAFAIGEVPLVRQAVEAVLTLFSGADGWAVFAVVPGHRRRRIVETCDSRYAAEQALVRWNRMAEEQSPDEPPRTIADAGSGKHGTLWRPTPPGWRRRLR